MADSIIFWHSKISSGVLERPIYQNQTAEVETAVGRTGPLSVQRGVRQGCPLSPMLFNLYSELIMIHALEKWEDGIEIGGKLYNNLRYADDVALLAMTEGKLQELVNAVSKASERFGLSLNAKKTQVMVIGRHTSTINIMYNGAPLEQVKQFIYLGASFNEKGDLLSRRPTPDMEEQRATNPTEEKTSSINDLADNELRFRDMDISKVRTEHDQRL